jgi:cytidylate kinase
MMKEYHCRKERDYDVMIIWINGTFGSGKTTTAYELHRRIKESFVFDPERFGFVLMANIPKEMAKGDFQDYPIWRETNYQLLKQVADGYQGVIIVPMTLSNEVYFEEIIGRLREDGVEIKHFTLMASEGTILKRLAKRFEGEKSWAYQQMEQRVKSLSKPIFQEHIQTDSLTIDEVIKKIAQRTSVELLPDNRSSLRKKIDRLLISLKEIRIF